MFKEKENNKITKKLQQIHEKLQKFHWNRCKNFISRINLKYAERNYNESINRMTRGKRHQRYVTFRDSTKPSWNHHTISIKKLTKKAKGNTDTNKKMLKQNNQKKLKENEIKVEKKVRHKILYNPNILHVNIALRNIVMRAVKNQIPWFNIDKVLGQCTTQMKIAKDYSLLQIRYRRKINLICLVNANNTKRMRREMQSTMQQYGATFSGIMRNFHYNCIIEVFASYGTTKYFTKFEHHLAKDAMELHVKSVEILDYETGAIKMHCTPKRLVDIVQSLIDRNYKVIFSDYGFRPLQYITLNSLERRLYIKFLNDLGKYRFILRIYDNLDPYEMDFQKIPQIL